MNQHIFNGGALASFTLITRVLGLLVARGILSREEMGQLLEEAAAAHSESEPAAEAARQMIEQLARAYQRDGKPAKH